MDWLVAHEDEGGDPEPSPTFVGGPREEESETQKALSEAGQERERRRRGQELERLRQRHLEEQQRRAAEERRRDRDEERLARQRVREKIERDKAERARKFGSIPAASEPPPAPPAAPAPAGQRHYEHCRLQVRLPDGRALTQSFRAREPLAAVRLFVELHRAQGDPSSSSSSSSSSSPPTPGPGDPPPGPPGVPPEPFELLTAFPRRRFTDDDMEKPLSELGLVPSAVLIVAKKEGS